MKFPTAALLFIISSFIFFILWIVTTFIVSTFHDAIYPLGSTLNPADQASFYDIMHTVPLVFGIICALFFVMGVILIFVLQSWSDEPEYYYRS